MLTLRRYPNEIDSLPVVETWFVKEDDGTPWQDTSTGGYLALADINREQLAKLPLAFNEIFKTFTLAATNADLAFADRSMDGFYEVVVFVNGAPQLIEDGRLYVEVAL